MRKSTQVLLRIILSTLALPKSDKGSEAQLPSQPVKQAPPLLQQRLAKPKSVFAGTFPPIRRCPPLTYTKYACGRSPSLDKNLLCKNCFLQIHLTPRALRRLGFDSPLLFIIYLYLYSTTHLTVCQLQCQHFLYFVFAVRLKL